MKLCSLFLGVASVIASTTPVECVPHARLARAAAFPAEAQSPINDVAKLLTDISNSLPPGTTPSISPKTGNEALDKIANTIVKAKIVEKDLKWKLPQENINRLIDGLVPQMGTASNTAKSKIDKMRSAVKNAAKVCTIVDCVFNKIGDSEKFLDKSIIDKLKQLQTAVDEMDPMGSLGVFGSNFGPFLNGAGPRQGFDSMLQGMGVPSKVFSGLQNVFKPADGSAPVGNAMSSL